MHFIYDGAHDAFNGLPKFVMEHGTKRDSRNGLTSTMEHPIILQIKNPRDRILLAPTRDANHTFHLIEALWMLSGRRDVDVPAYYVPGMKNYSDDGETFHAAYGYRWRHHFGYDQLSRVINRLTTYSDDRRCVLAMWDGRIDLQEENDCKDLPCNMLIKFAVRGEKLDMTVFNRSNDIVLGMLGANIVHMTILQEYIADRVGVDVGNYFVLSDDAHVYDDLVKKIGENYNRGSYTAQGALFNNIETFEEELEDFFMCWENDIPMIGRYWQNNILLAAGVLHRTYRVRKAEGTKAGFEFLTKAAQHFPLEMAPWYNATREWYARRIK